MTNIITLNGKQLAALNGQSVGQLNDKEVTQAIVKTNKQPFFDNSGNENISGLVYPFVITPVCNYDELSLTSINGYWGPVIREMETFESNLPTTIKVTNSFDKTTLRPTRNVTDYFSQWNTFTTSDGKYRVEMDDLPAYTYNPEGITEKCRIIYNPGNSVTYKQVGNEVMVDGMYWRNHTIKDVFPYTSLYWLSVGGTAVPTIHEIDYGWIKQHLYVYDYNDTDITGDMIRFDFSKQIGKKVTIKLKLYNAGWGRDTYFNIDLTPHTPTASEIHQDKYAWHAENPDQTVYASDQEREVELTANITAESHILTLYAHPYKMDIYHGFEGDNGKIFDILSISFDNN